MRASGDPIRQARWRWWWLFAMLSLATGAWSLVSPLMSGHDEGAHAVRGAAVARGQLLGSPAPDAWPEQPTVFIEVRAPEAYLLSEAMGCFNRRADLTPNCAPEFEGGRNLEGVHTYQFRSPPWYYAAVGWPSLVSPTSAGVYGMRLVTALATSALLASALTAALEIRRGGLLALGVLVAVTPEVLYLGGSINSNAVEVAAAIALRSAIVVIANVERDPNKRQVARAGVALVVLVGMRGLSPFFGGVILAVGTYLIGGSRARHLLRRADVRAWLGVAALMTLISLAYVAYVDEEFPIARPGQGLEEALGQVPRYLRQAVGVFGSNDILLPSVVYGLWAIAVVALLLAALLTARPRYVLAVVGLATLGVGIQVTAEGFALPPIGFFWQGRYALPLLVGVPIVAAASLNSARGARSRRLGWISRGAVPLLGLVIVAQVIGFSQAIRRFAVTLSGSANPIDFLFAPDWSPDPGAATVFLAMFAAGLVGAVAVVVGASRRPPVRPRKQHMSEPVAAQMAPALDNGGGITPRARQHSDRPHL